MVDGIVATITNLVKKHPGKPAYKGFYTLTKQTY
ncbi:hypothetical protein BH23THE1_BH23THE1_13470 [soil metagenome]